MNPPPLAKRLVVLTATISLLTSFAVLFVAIPKGIDEYVETAESTTTVPLVKGAANSHFAMLTANDVESCAIQMTPSIWVASSDHLNGVRTGRMTALGSLNFMNRPVRLFRSASVPYLVVASTDTTLRSPPALDFSAAQISAQQLSSASVIDCLNHQKMSVQRTPSQFAEKDEIPVYVSGDVHGMALVLNKSSDVLGFVCEHDHAQWLLEPRILGELMSTAR